MKRRDRWWGFIHSLRRWKVDHFIDHSIHNYIDAIFAAVQLEQQELTEGGVAKSGSEFAGEEREYIEEERVDLPHLKRHITNPPKTDKSSDGGIHTNEMRIQG